MHKLTKEILRNPAQSLSREWLVTNGLGGFASSTVIGLNTRRYHGLLTAATRPPVGRILMLSKLEETLVIDGSRFELSANQYPGVIHPQGYFYQAGFRLDPFPVFTYEIEGIVIEKSILMVQGENTTVVQYDVRAAETPKTVTGEIPDLRLEIGPLIAFRDYHGTTHENIALNPQLETADGIIMIRPYADLPALFLAHDPCDLDPSGCWYRNFEYSVERERGLDFTEDLFNHCRLAFDLTHQSRVRIVASTENGRQVSTVACQVETQRADTQDAATDRPPSPESADFQTALLSAADQFIVSREQHKTVIAGYPWFSDWGRDTMIALPGLTLVTGHAEIAKSILCEFSLHLDQGMLPNRFPDAGETPEYNTVDATLWFFEAIRALVEYTGDRQFVRVELYQILKDIIAWHVRGTRYNIKVDVDGLLNSGEPGVQLTWMDAKVGDWVVTPRQGKPVEIQALWYNALRVMEGLANAFGDKDARQYAAMARLARRSFNEKFWNKELGCLYDVMSEERRDDSIRPNQVIAVSLTHSMLLKQRAKSILHVVERELLTPRGLRTLSPSDPQYRGRYEGNSLSRDGAYHQGTVWPWLMGPYFTAYLKTFGVKAGRKFAEVWLRDFQPHLEEACLGQVSEIFDGDAPHSPRGCMAQAWSVAALMEALALFKSTGLGPGTSPTVREGSIVNRD
jgi:predicted glycogen debranching enzyme